MCLVEDDTTEQDTAREELRRELSVKSSLKGGEGGGCLVNGVACREQSLVNGVECREQSLLQRDILPADRGQVTGYKCLMTIPSSNW